MWIDDIEKELLQDLIRDSVCMYLATDFDGKIHWVSESFERWTGYTTSELQRIGWKKLSVDDESLSADLTAAKEIEQGTRVSYSVKKRYIPKGQLPRWGVLTVRRIPEKGPMLFAWCHWAPVDDDLAAPFEIAMETQKLCVAKMEAVERTMRQLTEQNAEERWMLATIRMIQNHPRVALTIVVVLLSIFGVNNVVELLQRTGLLPVPVPVKVDSDVRMNDQEQAHALALGIADHALNRNPDQYSYHLVSQC